MKKLVLSMAAAACLVGAMLTTAGAADVTESSDLTLTGSISNQNYVIEPGTDVTITVQGDVTLTGTGNAFTINADTTLEFAEGASLTLTGYDNGFVVENATLSGGGWVINDGDGMDLFRLKNSGELNITGNVDLNGHGNTDTTSRAIVLPGSSSGQEVALAANTTLSANNFYRGVETGGASGYTISGTDMNTSVFDFSGNDCGIAMSYFDRTVNYENCKLEVSNCETSGIYMRQDNASINGLYFNHVDINCVNNTTVPSDIAIRFHTGPFEFNDGKITIDGATTTGLWIYDSWNDDTQPVSKIDGSEIIISDVNDPIRNEGKGITFAIGHEWDIIDSVISFNDCGYAGINLSNDTQFNRSGVSYTASPRMVGGTLVVKDSTISAANMQENDTSALFTVQVGQYLELRDNVSVYNDSTNQPIVACALPTDPVPHWVLGIIQIDVYYANLSDELNVANRYTVTGGSVRDLYVDSDGGRNVPINDYGDKLELAILSEEQFDSYAENGVLTLTAGSGASYEYSVAEAAPDGKYYIWAPAGSFDS